MEHRYVTALYRSHSAAELVRQELATLGVAHGDIHVVPDAPHGGGGGSEGFEGLRRLDLPEDDIRSYERHLREGDVVVSAAVGEDLVAQAEEIMRRPGEFAHMHGDPLSDYRRSDRAEMEAGGFREDRDGFSGREARGDAGSEPLRSDDTILPTPAGAPSGQVRRSD